MSQQEDYLEMSLRIFHRYGVAAENKLKKYTFTLIRERRCVGRLIGKTHTKLMGSLGLRRKMGAMQKPNRDTKNT